MNQYQSLSDEALVPLVQHQDQELFVFLVKRYHKKLVRYAKYLGADDSQAEDIVFSDKKIEVPKELYEYQSRKSY